MGGNSFQAIWRVYGKVSLLVGVAGLNSFY
jgi:hypothetical protein